jgi:hypothetical protein
VNVKVFLEHKRFLLLEIGNVLGKTLPTLRFKKLGIRQEPKLVPHVAHDTSCSYIGRFFGEPLLLVFFDRFVLLEIIHHANHTSLGSLEPKRGIFLLVKFGECEAIFFKLVNG